MSPKKKPNPKKADPTGKGKKKPEEKQYKLSRSTRMRMSKAHTGKKLSEETKQKIRNARAEREWLIQNGLAQPFRHSEATKKKLSRIMKRKKHKPSKKAVQKSAEERSNRSLDKKIQRKIQRGQL